MKIEATCKKCGKKVGVCTEKAKIDFTCVECRIEAMPLVTPEEFEKLMPNRQKNQIEIPQFVGDTGLNIDELNYWVHELQTDQEANDIHQEDISNYYSGVM